MTDSRDLDEAVGAHLRGVARALDIEPGEPADIPVREGFRRRRQVRHRMVLAAAGVVAVAAAATTFGILDSDADSPVDTVDADQLERDTPDRDADGDAGERRPVAIEPFENTSPSVITPVTAFGTNWGVSLIVGSGGGEPGELVLSQDGVEWHSADGPAVEGFVGITGRDDLLAVARAQGDGLTVSTFDGRRWDDTTVPSPPHAQLAAIGASPTHLLVLVDVPGPDEVVWHEQRAQAQRQLEERFGTSSEYGKKTSPEGTTYTVSRDGQVIFDGTAEELDMDPALIEALFNGPPSSPDEERLYISTDGASWQQGEPPPEDGNSTVAASDIGLVQALTDAFAYTADGTAWTTVPAPGIRPDNRVVVSDLGDHVIASTETTVYRADTLAGPYRPVYATERSDTFIATAASWRGVVIVETTIEDSTDGIDSAAEAESLGLDRDTFQGPTISTRVLSSPDARTFEPHELDDGPNEPLTLHTVAPDGWIVVRSREMSHDSFEMGNGYKIDPGG